MSDLSKIEALEKQVQQLQTLVEHTLNNSVVLYKRMTTLAYMIETLAEQKQPQVTEAIRAEIDATLHPEEFHELFKRDPEEFTTRYGESIFNRVLEHGVESICRFGTLAAPVKTDISTLQ